MNPWHIIWYGFGWTIIGGCALGVLGWVAMHIIGPILAAFKVWRLYRKTRNEKPQAGDVWVQGDSHLRITQITDKGRICMTTGTASWSDASDEWPERVRNRRLYLVSRKEQP